MAKSRKTDDGIPVAELPVEAEVQTTTTEKPPEVPTVPPPPALNGPVASTVPSGERREPIGDKPCIKFGPYPTSERRTTLSVSIWRKRVKTETGEEYDAYSASVSRTYYNGGNEPQNSSTLRAPAMAAQIRWLGEERFRWFVSGDIQGINHLRNIIMVCLATPDVRHWLPSREAATVRALRDEIPANLTVRLSAALIDGRPPRDWAFTSTVVTVADADTCPSSVHGGSCADNKCVRCWEDEGNIAYLLH